MWDKHLCTPATRRAAQLAGPQPRRPVRAAARRADHPRSDRNDGHYQAWPQRTQAINARTAENAPLGITGARGAVARHDYDFPLRDADRDCEQRCRGTGTPTRPRPEFQIHQAEIVSDSNAAIWNVIKQRGIKNVVLAGVHANESLLSAPFAIRYMVGFGKQVALMRDLTDTVPTPRRETHRATPAPSFLNSGVVGQDPFTFPADSRSHVVIVAADKLYHPNRCLSEFSRAWMGRDFKVKFLATARVALTESSMTGGCHHNTLP